MLKNRNGYWMSPGFAAMYAPDTGAAASASGASSLTASTSGTTASSGTNTAVTFAGADTSTVAGDTSANGENGGKQGGEDDKGGNTSSDDLNAQIAKLQAEIVKQKAALDKATHEASAANKALKAKMTQEEIDAAAKQEAEEKAAKELEDLRREVAKGKTVKTVMGKLGLDEEAAGNLAEHLYGAADIDNALLEIQKAWQAREKALKLEFGKITGPGAGVDSNSPEAQAIKRATDVGKARNAASEQAQKAMSAYIR